MTNIQEKYEELARTPSDINQHLPTLKRYAEQCDHVTEFGVRSIVSTWAFMAAMPERLVSIDIKHPKEYGGDLQEVIDAAYGLVDFEFKVEDTTKNKIEKTDLLFIDTLHNYAQLKSELRHAGKVRKFIILHDTVRFGVTGVGGGDGLLKAMYEFLAKNKNWTIVEQFGNNNGLTIIGRIIKNENN